MKEDYDGAEPSGNSVVAMNLFRLARITGREDFERAGMKTLEALASRINDVPFAVPQMLAAFEFSRNPPKQLVLAGEDVRAMLREFHSKFLPGYVLLAGGKPGMPAINGRATAYVCENFVCRLPVTKVEELSGLLQ